MAKKTSIPRPVDPVSIYPNQQSMLQPYLKLDTLSAITVNRSAVDLEKRMPYCLIERGLCKLKRFTNSKLICEKKVVMYRETGK